VISILISTYGTRDWAEQGSSAFQAAAAHGTEVIHRHQDEGTIATSRNASAESATRDWLCFLDADDQLDEHFIPWMEKLISRHPDEWKRLYTPAIVQVRGRSRRGPFFYPECSLETGNWLIIGTVISKRLFTEIGGFREHPHGLEDWNLWRRAIRAGAEIIKVKRAVYIAHYNHHSKHHQIRRNHREYVAAYERAKADV
jgi:glycosyltransferase involved in cell wall biosynthesis